MPKPMPVCLSIAGSDSGGGAGIQADLRSFHDAGVFGCTAITAVTAQNPQAVTAVHAMPPATVAAQIEAVCDAFTVAAVKTGMLFSTEIISQVAAVLSQRCHAPLVLDPVMVATSGARLLQADALTTLRRELIPLATLLTPNLAEAEICAERELPDFASTVDAARALAARHRTAVLIKGGHRQGEELVRDVLATDTACFVLSAPALPAPSTHGTGCSLSAACAAQLARGADLLTAVQLAKGYVWQCLRGCRQVGPGTFAMWQSAETAPVTVTAIG